MRGVGVIEFGGPEALQVVDLPEVHAGPGEVRLRVHAATVNPTDTFVRGGARADAPPRAGPAALHPRHGRRRRPSTKSAPTPKPTSSSATASWAIGHPPEAATALTARASSSKPTPSSAPPPARTTPKPPPCP